jgi:pyruvate dehydrogenase complex dehydrogenase (E1) component
MHHDRSAAVIDAVKDAAKPRGRARVRLVLEIYDHKTQRYRYVRRGSWATDIAGDQGEALEKGINEVMKRVEKKI